MEVRKAKEEDVEGICRVCAEGWRDTYPGLMSNETIERVIADFYNPQRIRSEVIHPDGWNGWWVVAEDGKIVGAGGGGLTTNGTGEVFVLYVDPQKRGQGIGTQLLQAITDEMKAQGVVEQWVAVARGNNKGIPFYIAHGFILRDERPLYGLPTGEHLTSVRYWRKI